MTTANWTYRSAGLSVVGIVTVDQLERFVGDSNIYAIGEQ